MTRHLTDASFPPKTCGKLHKTQPVFILKYAVTHNVAATVTVLASNSVIRLFISACCREIGCRRVGHVMNGKQTPELNLSKIFKVSKWDQTGIKSQRKVLAI